MPGQKRNLRNGKKVSIINRMKVLFVTSEAAPIKKYGGLGDYSGALPKALGTLGVNADVMLPFYDDIAVQNLKIFKNLDLLVPFNNTTYPVEIHKTKLPDSDVDVLLVKLFEKFTPETEYFSFFDRCVVEYIKSQYNTYDIVHCNDWHTGFVTHLLQDELGAERPKTLITIHNLGFQGVADPTLVKELGFAPGDHPLIDWDIADGNVNMLLQAITSSDFISTVSESYAKEVLTPEFGYDLYEVLTARKDRFVGILNGVDYSTLPRSYDATNWQQAKKDAKQKMQTSLGLPVSTVPVFSFVSRIDPNQKGLELLLAALPYIKEQGAQFVLLGTGAHDWEQKFVAAAQEQLSINIKFDSQLALDIYAGSDFFFVPSKYEPCGLTQMISMWYGTLPIVHNVGGLKDTVRDHENGFTFEDYSTDALTQAIKSALNVYTDPTKYQAMVNNALGEDFGWAQSALKYKNLYAKMLSS